MEIAQPAAAPKLLGSGRDRNGNVMTVEVDSRGMCNATKMCQGYNKQVAHYKDTDGMREYLRCLSSSTGIPIENLWHYDKSAAPTNRATWAHQRVAVILAMRISPEFSVYVTDVMTRYMKGVVTTEESKAAAANLAQRHLPRPAMEMMEMMRDGMQEMLEWKRQVDSRLESIIVKPAKRSKLDPPGVPQHPTPPTLPECELSLEEEAPPSKRETQQQETAPRNSLETFLASDKFVYGEGHEISAKILWANYKVYCKENKLTLLSREYYGADRLKAALSRAKPENTPRVTGTRPGITNSGVVNGVTLAGWLVEKDSPVPAEKRPHSSAYKSAEDEEAFHKIISELYGI